MKKAFLSTALLLMSASVALAQSTAAPAAQSQPPAAQSPAPAAPATAPATPQTSVNAPNAKGAPQPKTQEEYKAYQAVITKTDPAQFETASDEFAQKYPNSDLRVVLFKQLMNMYRGAGQTDRAIAAGRKALSIDPTDPVPNVMVAFSLAQSTHDTDLDRDDRLNEATADAQRSIDNVDSGMAIPPNTPADRVIDAKRGIQAMAYETLGTIAMTKKNFPAAEVAFRKGIDVNKAEPDGVLYLRLAIALDNDKKYQEALDATDNAIKYNQSGSEALDLANKEKARLQKLVSTQPTATPGPTAQ
ncbi:MAG TPA: hypothetical protein VGL89_03450 [Candidatus Koribacter sp.]|jgi:tetratricopeptide (TPR) repeat protein